MPTESYPTFKKAIGATSTRALSIIMNETTMKIVKTPILNDLVLFKISE